MKRQCLILLAAALVWLGLSPAAFAGFHETVLAVGADTIQVKTGSRGPQAGGVTFKVDERTLITVDDLPGKLSDVHPGMVVTVSMGLDANTAGEIVAHTVPPARKAAGRSTTQALGVGLTSNVVIAITDTRITYGVPGTEEGRAALMTPQTRVIMDNAPISASELEPGMQVEVITVDGVHAREIHILGQDKNQ